MARFRLATFAAVLLCSASTSAHDWRHSELDSWYANLKKPTGFQCCSRTDCHTTEAELRGGDWWARLGIRRPDGDWDLMNWVKVPPQAVLQQHDNPTGEAVICHSLNWAGNDFTPSGIMVWCFVPPSES
jgi:hypothetical protein